MATKTKSKRVTGFYDRLFKKRLKRKVGVPKAPRIVPK